LRDILSRRYTKKRDNVSFERFLLPAIKNQQRLKTDAVVKVLSFNLPIFASADACFGFLPYINDNSVWTNRHVCKKDKLSVGEIPYISASRKGTFSAYR
jgi:hypothetical protein